MNPPALEKILTAKKSIRSVAENRVLVVGESPARIVHPESDGAFFPWPRNSSGFRLWSMSELPLREWFMKIERVNVLDSWPGPDGKKGSHFPKREAKDRAVRMVGDMNMDGRVVVFVGKRTASLFRESLPDPFRFQDRSEGGWWTWIPHSSGVVRIWNDPENRKRVGFLFSEALERARRMEAHTA